MAVAALFFVVDLVRAAPLSTPLSLSRSLLEASLSVRESEVLQNIADLTLGGRLAVFTGIHLTVFALFGVLAAGLANLFHVHWNARTGAVAGFLFGAAAWLVASRAGPVWMATAGLTPEAIVGAGVLGGAVLGWHLRLCHIDADEAPTRAAAFKR
jgi:hypothetical protein